MFADGRSHANFVFNRFQPTHAVGFAAMPSAQDTDNLSMTVPGYFKHPSAARPQPQPAQHNGSFKSQMSYVSPGTQNHLVSSNHHFTNDYTMSMPGPSHMTQPQQAPMNEAGPGYGCDAPTYAHHPPTTFMGAAGLDPTAQRIARANAIRSILKHGIDKNTAYGKLRQEHILVFADHYLKEFGSMPSKVEFERFFPRHALLDFGTAANLRLGIFKMDLARKRNGDLANELPALSIDTEAEMAIDMVRKEIEAESQFLVSNQTSYKTQASMQAPPLQQSLQQTPPPTQSAEPGHMRKLSQYQVKVEQIPLTPANSILKRPVGASSSTEFSHIQRQYRLSPPANNASAKVAGGDQRKTYQHFTITPQGKMTAGGKSREGFGGDWPSVSNDYGNQVNRHNAFEQRVPVYPPPEGATGYGNNQWHLQGNPWPQSQPQPQQTQQLPQAPPQTPTQTQFVPDNAVPRQPVGARRGSGDGVPKRTPKRKDQCRTVCNGAKAIVSYLSLDENSSPSAKHRKNGNPFNEFNAPSAIATVVP